MAFDPVPWMVGGGAQHSAEIGRVVAFFAANSNEGIGALGDLKVTQQTVAGSSVLVAPGVCGIICRASAQTSQMYAGRLPIQDSVSIAATGGAVRSDMVIARVEDPWLAGEPWADPTDPGVGPYIFLRVISGVSSTAKTLADAGRSGDSAIPLARIDIPASTAAITNAMITDLRVVANPRREIVINHLMATAADSLNAGAEVYEQWPAGISYTYQIPSWATRAIVTGFVEGAKLTASGAGSIRVTIGGTQATQATNVNESAPPAGFDRRSYNVGGMVTIPSAMRGTTQTIRMEGLHTTSGNSGFLTTDTATSGQIQVIFEERAN